MPRAIHEFQRPERFIAGTVGQPGDRTFYVQAIDGPRTISVQLEKQQVAILADRLGFLLDEVARRFGTEVPAATSVVHDSAPLSTPIDVEFRVGTMGLGWDAESAAVVVELLEVTEDEPDENVILDDSDTGPDTVRVHLSPAAAREFAARATRVIAAGRPACPLCSFPIDPAGHLCARNNGYHRQAEFSAPTGTGDDSFIAPEVLATLGTALTGFDASFTVDESGRVFGPGEGPDQPHPGLPGSDLPPR